MPLVQMMMLAVALLALAVVLWAALTGRLGLGPAAAVEEAKLRSFHPADGMMLLAGVLGALFGMSVGGSLGMRIVGPSEVGLGLQSLVPLASAAGGMVVIGTLAWFWTAAHESLWSSGATVRGGLRWGVGGAAVLLPVVWGVGVLAAWLWRALAGPVRDPIAHDTLRAMVNAPFDLGWWAMAAAVVIAVPIVEESLYRGLLQTGVWRMLRGMALGCRPSGGCDFGATARDPGSERAAWSAVAIVSVLFATMHLGIASPVTMPTLLCLSIGLGWLRIRSGSMLAPIVAHAAFNAMNLGLASAYAVS
jgi:membrane protease YdiL (CAAX protease family)